MRPCAPESPEETITEMPRAPMAMKPELRAEGQRQRERERAEREGGQGIMSSRIRVSNGVVLIRLRMVYGDGDLGISTAATAWVELGGCPPRTHLVALT